MENSALLAFAEATNNELFDPAYKNGEWMTEAVETQETLEQFIDSSKTWASRTPVHFGEIAGFKFAYWKEMQTAKDQPRRSLSVIDFGDLRVALPHTDITYFV